MIQGTCYNAGYTAGSPAEINLIAHEIVNMAVTRYLKALDCLIGLKKE